jgi:L-ectoine synthase
MKIQRINQLHETERSVKFTGGISIRPIIASDGMGFSVHKTIIPKGKPNFWHYPNHLEACYCIKGKGVLTNLETSEEHLITTDTVYLLDNHDKHTFEALEDTVLISVFNPPVMGNEKHDKQGNYPESEYINIVSERLFDMVKMSTSKKDALTLIKKLLTNKINII